MNVKKLCCQGCGSDLVVDEGIRFVTCNYCGARLEIVHDATTTHSRLLDKIEKRTGEMAPGFFLSGSPPTPSLPCRRRPLTPETIYHLLNVCYLGPRPSGGS